MKSAIKVHNLSKMYRIQHDHHQGYTALRDQLVNGAKNIFSTLKHPLAKHGFDGPSFEDFWALKDICFDIMPGERVGVIGRNGAGKSTLLKTLSRITDPTRGRIELRGRVASLLEVGTGFHPELTGRENIFLNGAILGMSKNEIARKFDDIVDFAEVEKFLDTPVKRYSSGMYVRLAFAVAANLDSDILIVDEVLAVGDSDFQKKCMNRMQSVSGDGRTVLFVSHNIGAISELCDRAILLENGVLRGDGPPAKIIDQYLVQVKKSDALLLNNRVDAPIYVSKIKLMDLDGIPIGELPLGSDMLIELTYHLTEPLVNVSMAILLSRMGSALLYSYDTDQLDKDENEKRLPGDYKATITLPTSKFKEGVYTIEIKIGVGQSNMTDDRATLSFEISNYTINTTHKSYRSDRPGHLYWPLSWTTNKL